MALRDITNENKTTLFGNKKPMLKRKTEENSLNIKTNIKKDDVKIGTQNVKASPVPDDKEIEVPDEIKRIDCDIKNQNKTTLVGIKKPTLKRKAEENNLNIKTKIKKDDIKVETQNVKASPVPDDKEIKDRDDNKKTDQQKFFNFLDSKKVPPQPLVDQLTPEDIQKKKESMKWDCRGCGGTFLTLQKVNEHLTKAKMLRLRCQGNHVTKTRRFSDHDIEMDLKWRKESLQRGAKQSDVFT